MFEGPFVKLFKQNLELLCTTSSYDQLFSIDLRLIQVFVGRYFDVFNQKMLCETLAHLHPITFMPIPHKLF